MDKIEEVKKILETSSLDTKLQREIVAREICQLFELIQGVISKRRKRPDLMFPPEYYEPKPDESRLLTDREIVDIRFTLPEHLLSNPDIVKLWIDDKDRAMVKAQDAKTYPIAFEEGYQVGIAKCQARVERIFKEIEAISLLGNAGGKVVILSEDWQALKKQEGIK